MAPDSLNLLMIFCTTLMMEVSKPSQLYTEHYSEISPQFLDTVFCRLPNICPSVHLSDSASWRCSFYTQSCYWPVAIWPNSLHYAPSAYLSNFLLPTSHSQFLMFFFMSYCEWNIVQDLQIISFCFYLHLTQQVECIFSPKDERHDCLHNKF